MKPQPPVINCLVPPCPQPGDPDYPTYGDTAAGTDGGIDSAVTLAVLGTLLTAVWWFSR